MIVVLYVRKHLVHQSDVFGNDKMTSITITKLMLLLIGLYQVLVEQEDHMFV